MQPKQSTTERFITHLKAPHEVLDGVKAELEARGSEPELSISSLPYFNRQIWGLKKGLTILAGRTSMGKSALALQMAYDLADQQKEVLFLSLEMTVESLIERLFCNRMEVDNYDMLTGKMKINTEYQEKWGTFVKLMDIPLKLSCGLGKTFDDINGLIELLDPKPKIIIIDYIQAIRKTANERLDMDDYIIRFRELCLLHNIAGVLISQNSRKVFEEETKEPTLANLKGTGTLEEAADTVILLFWPHFYNEKIDKNLYKIIIAKQRNGRTGDHFLHYTPEYYKFTDTKKEETDKIKDKLVDTFDARENL